MKSKLLFLLLSGSLASLAMEHKESKTAKVEPLTEKTGWDTYLASVWAVFGEAEDVGDLLTTVAGIPDIIGFVNRIASMSTDECILMAQLINHSQQIEKIRSFLRLIKTLSVANERAETGNAQYRKNLKKIYTILQSRLEDGMKPLKL